MELRYDSKNDSRSELRLQLKMRMTFVIPTSTQLERSVSSQYYRTMYSPNHSSDSYDGCIENISSEQTTSTIRESLRGQEPSVMYKLYQVPGTCTPDSYLLPGTPSIVACSSRFLSTRHEKTLDKNEDKFRRLSQTPDFEHEQNCSQNSCS